ncbi:MAG TPA: ABC transporter permease, partial [Chryseolinea sp.]|nr:ABC transporter permease [Chryseolinea sp.]
MIRHNILIAYRNSRRYKSSFFINLVGLSTGLACVILIFLWVNDELRMDQLHAHGDRLYQVLENVDQGTGMITRYSTSGPTAEALATEMPEVEMAITSTLQWERSFVASTEDKDISATGVYADVDFFRMFSYDLLQGEPKQVLSDKKGIVIDESLAISLFGKSEDIIGKMVTLNHDKQYQVSGIMKDIGLNSSHQFDFVISFEAFREENEWVRTWFNTAPQTHVLLRPGTDIAQFNKKIFDLVRTKTEGKANHRSPFVRLESEGYLYGRYENGVLAGGRIDYVKLFSIIATFILLIACINFMNLSTARASRRIKEVGVKKAIGAMRRNLISQYLGESTLTALFSLGVALLIVWTLLPKFNEITAKQLTLSIDPTVTLFVMGIVIVTGLIAGSYPALYLSRFSPAAVLKGKLSSLTGEVWARKGLVVFQFVLSIMLIVSVWVVYEQINFIQTRNLGYNKDNIIILNREGNISQKQDAFFDEVKKVQGVVAASASGHDMTGHNGGTYGVEWTGKNPDDRTEFERVTVDYGMIELLDVEMKDGRSFSKDHAEENKKIIFNEAA